MYDCRRLGRRVSRGYTVAAGWELQLQLQSQ